MKKLLLLFSFLLVNAISHADVCKVSGIGDSPQSITCIYKDGQSHHIKLNIFCEQGKYKFMESVNEIPNHQGDITSTYHEEVERGASPLNFVFDDTRTLRVTKFLRLFFRGEFSNSNGSSASNGRFSCSVR